MQHVSQLIKKTQSVLFEDSMQIGNTDIQNEYHTK
jgi:hypothetical protein